ncbi:hypothetical protein OAG52_04170 [Verrucomicrobia bacterium]|nr:hypothetical protein [Verrucomicrobiota bacterium]
MKNLKRLIGKTAMTAMAAGLLYGSTVSAATTNVSKCPSGQFKCLVSPPP